MYFPFCSSKRRALKKGEHAAGQAPQQPDEQARAALSFTPTSKGQVETERLLSGDVAAADDLKHLLFRAEQVSRVAPRLNLNVHATERWLQGSPEAVEDLVEEQRLAQMRAKRAASEQWFGFSLMRTTSLIGESFKHSCREWCGDSLSSSAEVKDGECRGHWQLHYCPGGEGCNAQHSRPLTPQSRPVAAEDDEGETQRPVPDGESEGDEEDEDEFPFDDHLTDEDNYQQALCEVTALAARPAPAKIIFIPARTATLRRKRGQSSLRRSSSTGPSEAAPPERWSTQVRTGCRGSLSGAQGEEGRGEDVPRGRGARRSGRLSMVAGPLSGPPAVPLPPSPPVSWPLRASWPLPPIMKDIRHAASTR